MPLGLWVCAGCLLLLACSRQGLAGVASLGCWEGFNRTLVFARLQQLYTESGEYGLTSFGILDKEPGTIQLGRAALLECLEIRGQNDLFTTTYA